MKNFILSFILPRKMEEHRDMNLFIAVLLFLLSMIICSGIPTGRLTKVIKKNYLTDCYVFNGTYDATFNSQIMPTYEITNGEISSFKLINDKKVYDFEYKLPDESVINLKIVYQFDVDKEHGIDRNVFDIDEYLNQNPFNEDHSLKQKDVLAVFTKNGLYYIFNHGYSYGYVNNKEATLEQVHYLNIKAWADTGKWSIYEHELDMVDGQEVYTAYYVHPANAEELQNDPSGATWTYISTSKDALNGLEYTPKQRINNNLYELFHYSGTPNVGFYSYATLENLGKDYLTFDENPLAEMSDLLVLDLQSSVKTYNYILSFFYVMVLPIMWVLIVWLVMHKNGVLSRFREYYAVASVAFLVPSIIIGIVGLFIPYQIISRFAMILHAGYYFICASRINSMDKPVSNKENKAKKDSEIIDVESEINTTPINELNYNEPEEHKEQNKSHISQIE
jgi:hypothetical protein